MDWAILEPTRFSHVYAALFISTSKQIMSPNMLQQLLDISHRVLELLQNQERSQEQTCGIWLDTLCCPIQPYEAKKRSIELIREVYRNATHVLVLDASLRLHSTAGRHCTELLVRIFNSGWIRRLWTLQGSMPLSSPNTIHKLGLQNHRGCLSEIVVCPIQGSCSAHHDACT